MIGWIAFTVAAATAAWFFHQRRELEKRIADLRPRNKPCEKEAALGRAAEGLVAELHRLVALQREQQGRLPGLSKETASFLEAGHERFEEMLTQWSYLAHPEPPRVQRLVLTEVFHAAIEKIRPLADTSGITIQNEISPSLRVRADARLLRQAVGDILQNSIEAMPEGGLIMLRAYVGNPVRVLLRDTSTGLEPGAANHYTFTVSRELLRLQGGEILVANAAAGGCEITIEIPASRSSQEDEP